MPSSFREFSRVTRRKGVRFDTRCLRKTRGQCHENGIGSVKYIRVTREVGTIESVLPWSRR